MLKSINQKTAFDWPPFTFSPSTPTCVSLILEGVGNNYSHSCFELSFFMKRHLMGPCFTPIKFCILNRNLKNPATPQPGNMPQFACSRLAKVAYYTAKSPVQFLIWPVDDRKKLLDIYLSFLVSASGLIFFCRN